MNVKEEQRVCVKFCVKLGKMFTETFQMLQVAFGDECLSRSRCHEWYKRFKEGRRHQLLIDHMITIILQTPHSR
ncbi:hypothetical protein [Klebsiella pneumoniae]|uniref:hypothetical protein n=1 Tax=Klebsiella pneumoniae TaxID=573 RepID=UPI0040554228